MVLFVQACELLLLKNTHLESESELNSTGKSEFLFLLRGSTVP